MNDEDFLRSALHEHANSVQPSLDAGGLNDRLDRADRNTRLVRVAAGAAAVVVVAAVGLGLAGRSGNGATDLNTAGPDGGAATIAPPVTTAAPATTAAPSDADSTSTTGATDGANPTEDTPAAPGAGAPGATAPASTTPSTAAPNHNPGPTAAPSKPSTTWTAPTTPKPTTTTPSSGGCSLSISPTSGAGNPFTISFSGSVNQPGATITVGVVTSTDQILATQQVTANSSGAFSGSITVASGPTGNLKVKDGGGGCNGNVIYYHTA
jgi:hypothetical protein